MKILALDVGEKRIGFAATDELGVGVWPQEPFLRQKKEIDFENLVSRIKELAPQLLVIGAPYRMDGSEGSAYQRTQNFIKKLKSYLEKQGIEIPIEICDERLSSWEAEQQLMTQGFKGKEKKKRVDSRAACIILEDFLSQKKL